MRTLKIGNVTLENNLILAPMAGVTDLPFRLLCKEQGAGLICMEMVSAKAISFHNRNTEALMEIDPREKPVSLQLFGSDPDIISEMAKYIEEKPFDILDLNMGCPVPKVVNNGEGSALLKNPELIRQIITKTAKAIKKPVTAKIRIGFEGGDVDVVELAKIIEDSGAAAIAVHGRTRVQYYSGKADWDTIARVKDAVSIPVIGNGDVNTGEDAVAMMEQTGCDGVMIARGALGNPWIFRDAQALWKGEDKPPAPSKGERILMLIRHLDMVAEDKGERIAVREMRKHVGWYVRGMHGASAIKREINQIDDIGIMRETIRSIIK